MKRKLLSALFFLCCSFLNAKDVIELYVSPEGSDGNKGTLEAPFKTIQKARDYIRTIKGEMESDIFVYLRGGDNLSASVYGTRWG